MSTVTIKAPVSGFLMPIEQVPDPVFAEKMLGDGVAIDPLSDTLLAPCDGRILQLHDAHHALTVVTAEGVQIMMHIGLDTVALRGHGFRPRVRVNDFVKSGQPLIEFDPDFIAQNAPSLLILIVVVNSDRVIDFGKARGETLAGVTPVMTLFLHSGDITTGEPVALDAEAPTATVTMPIEAGLHLRPAAVFSGLAAAYDAKVRLFKGIQSADAASILALLSLDVGCNDQVTLAGTGAEAEEAVAALALAVERGLGEEGAPPIASPAGVSLAAIAAPAPPLRPQTARTMTGVTASPGLSVGNIHQFRRTQTEPSPRAGFDPYNERAVLKQAIDGAARDLQALGTRLRQEGDAAAAALTAAQEALLHDPALRAAANETIDANFSAAYAWQMAANAQAAGLEALKNKSAAARAADLRDLGQRVLRHMKGDHYQALKLPVNTVLIAEDLSPDDIAHLDRGRIAGIATVLGGATSDSAIAARAAGLPYIAGIAARALSLPDGTPAVLNATAAALHLKPTAEEIAYVVGMLRKRVQKRQSDQQAAAELAITRDGYRIEVTAVIADQAEAEEALRLGAEGIGLLCTESMFRDRRAAPTEEAQAEAIAAIAGVLGRKKRLVIRTLDTGSESAPSYLAIASEANPALGERGLRATLNRPQILRTQIRAILRASAAGGNLHILLPMIATLDEWRAAKSVIAEEVANLGLDPLPVGLLVEAPAAAIMAAGFAQEADFFSIGANNLAQYILAMDRGHNKLAPQVDALHPAVLRLIAQTTVGGQKHGRPTAVYGLSASDPGAVPILIGLGVKEFSVSVPNIPMIKALIRSLSLEETRKKARHALTLESAAAVRALYPLEDYEL